MTYNQAQFHLSYIASILPLVQLHMISDQKKIFITLIAIIYCSFNYVTAKLWIKWSISEAVEVFLLHPFLICSFTNMPLTKLVPCWFLCIFICINSMYSAEPLNKWKPMKPKWSHFAKYLWTLHAMEIADKLSYKIRKWNWEEILIGEWKNVLSKITYVPG